MLSPRTSQTARCGRGNNLDVLRGLNSESIDLIYADPPFNSNKNYEAPIGSKTGGAGFKNTWTLSDVDIAWQGEIADREPKVYNAIDNADIVHSKSMKNYLIMMAVRLLELRRVLKPTGSLYLHCNPTANSYLRVLLDAVFGATQFRNEITWKRQSSHNRARQWAPVHDTLLFYTAAEYTWNRILEPLDQEYIKPFDRHKDDEGHYQASDLTARGTRTGDTGKTWQNVDPTYFGRHWEVPPDHALPEWFVHPDGYAQMQARERLDELNKQGLVYWPPRGRIPKFKRYLNRRRNRRTANQRTETSRSSVTG